MKGSDKWGQGTGPRLELVLAALVALSLVGLAFYYVATVGNTSAGQGAGTRISTTGTPCDDPSVPQVAQLAQRDSKFLALSGGRCFNYTGQSSSSSQGNLTLTFAYYDGTVSYPCGTSPVMSPESEILVTVSNGRVVSAQPVAPNGLENSIPSCDPSIPVRILAVDDVESTIPAVPQLNLTLLAASGARPVTALKAVLTLDGGAQSFQFSQVSPAKPLPPGGSASMVEIVLSSVSFSSNEVYPAVISGTFDNGQAFGYTLHFQITHVPST